MNRSIPHAALAVAALLVSSASGQVVIVDDSFADGSPQNSGAEGETRFFNTSANLALDDAPQGDDRSGAFHHARDRRIRREQRAAGGAV